MATLSHLFRRYTGILRQFKGVYVINNLLNRGRLRHNRALYRQYGLNKPIYAPVGSGDFPDHHPDIPWLDRPGALEALRRHPSFGAFDPEIQAQLEHFVTDGYLILKRFFPSGDVDRLNADIDRLLSAHTLDFNYTGRKIMESFRVSPAANAFFRDERLCNLLSFLMGKPVIPFHTINFLEGSEQRPHSDFIHMTTEPLGYLIAAWIALEDIGPDQGPLTYYPGSHRLPYLSTKDYDSGNTRWMIGAESNRRYEEKIAEVIREHNLSPATFLAGKGDVLIWHANLIHGGSPITRRGATRRSMVAHYFCEGVICYHEISQRPALLPD